MARLLVVDDHLPGRRGGAGFGRMLDAVRELTTSFRVAVHAMNVDSRKLGPLHELGVDVIGGELEHHLATPGVRYDVVVISRSEVFERCAGAVRTHQQGTVLVYDAEALAFRRLERLAALEPDPVAAAVIATEAVATRGIEERVAREADRIVSVSPDEAAWLEQVPATAPST